ncbi:MAG: EfeM/EfeO family lipoprotein [Myxococcota bacterium]
MPLRLLVVVFPFALFACTPPDHAALLETKSYVQQNLDQLVTASTALCAAAPSAAWSASTHASAVSTMRAEWKKARVAYERVEGSIAVLFPELDESTDQRYDGFLENATDPNLFDDQVVTGIHGVERILFSDEISAEVKSFEEGLGSKYVAAAFPATDPQAADFKNKLCAKLVTDVTKMRDDYRPLALDTAAAFRGVIGSMEEQLEKTTFAATGEEESRYARHTLADMKANLEGAAKTYEAFRPWLQSKGERALDERILAGLARVKAAYDAQAGEALPTPPASWSSVSPSAADLESPFGRLYTVIEAETKHTGDALVASMLAAASALGIPELPQD